MTTTRRRGSVRDREAIGPVKVGGRLSETRALERIRRDLVLAQQEIRDRHHAAAGERVDQALTLLGELLDQVEAGIHTNPALVIYGNPPGRHIGREVYGVEYRHAKDGKDYRHDFEGGAELWGLEDGSLLIRSRKGRRHWEDFPE